MSALERRSTAAGARPVPSGGLPATGATPQQSLSIAAMPIAAMLIALGCAIVGVTRRRHERSTGT